MSWNAIKVPIFVGIGLAAPGLLVLGIKTVPPDLIVFRTVEVEAPRVFVPTEPVTFARREPVEFDPFRSVLPRPAPKKEVKQAVAFQKPRVQIVPPPAVAPKVMTAMAPTVPVEIVGPDPILEGVVAGENPVAVLKIGEESLFARVGQTLQGGFEVLSITDGEVRLRRGNSELVLKTGIR